MQTNEECFKKMMVRMQIENKDSLKKSLFENRDALQKALDENKKSLKNVFFDLKDEMDRTRKEMIRLNITVMRKASNKVDALVLATAKKRAASDISNSVKTSKAKRPKVANTKVRSKYCQHGARC